MLIDTKDTEIDLTGDGKPDVFRRFDSEGRIVYFRREDYLATPPRKEIIEYSADRRTRIRKVYAGNALVEDEVSTFDGNEGLVRRETVKGGLRVVERFTSGLQAEVRVYEKKGSDWGLKSSSKEWTVFLQDAYPACSGAGSAAGSEDCDSAGAGAGNPAAGTGFQFYTNTHCQSGNDLRLGNVLRVDLRSCNTRDAQDAIRAATRSLAGTDGMLSCMQALNPNMAAKMITRLTSEGEPPRIRCAGDSGRLDLERELCPEGAGTSDADRQACLSLARSLRNRTGGFHTNSRPNDIFLTADDPVLNESTRTIDVGDSGAATAAAGLNPVLAGTIFHELIHACGHSGGPHHNEPHFGDEVYGCSAICGGDTRALTEEGCSACLRAEGNSLPRSHVRAQCGQFPPAEPMRKLRTAESIVTLIDRCDSQFDFSRRRPVLGASQPACDHLRSLPEFAQACPSRPIPYDSEFLTCQRNLRALAGRLTREAFHSARRAGKYDVMMSYFTSDHLPSVGRNAQGRPTLVTHTLTITEDLDRYEGERNIFVHAMMVDGFCSEVLNEENLTTQRIRAIRNQYDQKVGNPTVIGATPERGAIAFRLGRGPNAASYAQPVLNRGHYTAETDDPARVRSYCGLLNTHRSRFISNGSVLRSGS